MLLAKASFESTLLETAPSQILYKYFNSLCRSGTIPPPLIFDSNSAATDAEKATLFNNYFHSVYTQSSVTIPPLVNLPTPNLTLSDISVSELDVFSALSSLNSTKAMGIDGIGPKLLKHCALALYKPIHHLFILSISQQCVPLDWRLHLITPLHKSGDKSSVRKL